MEGLVGLVNETGAAEVPTGNGLLSGRFRAHDLMSRYHAFHIPDSLKLLGKQETTTNW